MCYSKKLWKIGKSKVHSPDFRDGVLTSMPFKGVLGGFITVHKVEKDVKGKLKKFLRNPNFLFLVQISTPVTFPVRHMLKN